MGPAGSKLTRIDPASGDVLAEVTTRGLCCDLAVGAGRIWAIDPRGELMSIDPTRARIADRFPVPFDPDVHTNVVFGGGSVWIGSDGAALAQVDPRTGNIERMVETHGGPPFLAKDGLVWGAAPDLIWGVEASTGEVVRSIPLEDSMEVISMGIGLGSIWVGIRHPGYVGALLQIDPSNGRVTADLPNIDIPARIAIGFDSVRVTDSGSSNVFRVAPG